MDPLYNSNVLKTVVESRNMAMLTTYSYSDARANLASLLDRVVENWEVVIINRRGDEDVAVVSASELSGLLETAHLLRSPKNVQRLLAALKRAETTKDK